MKGERGRAFTADEIVAFARKFDLPIGWFFLPSAELPEGLEGELLSRLPESSPLDRPGAPPPASERVEPAWSDPASSRSATRWTSRLVLTGWEGRAGIALSDFPYDPPVGAPAMRIRADLRLNAEGHLRLTLRDGADRDILEQIVPGAPPRIPRRA